MMQAIRTRFLGPTNTKGARIVVEAFAGRKVYNWHYGSSDEENHKLAAIKFAISKNWLYSKMHGGQLKDGSYVFVMEDEA